tara:strand:- start:417 stop:866 length:450 start_codon:yes stop_codon:yes gene_type:complete
MKRIVSIIKVLVIYLVICSGVLAKESEYFDKGKKFFQKEEFEKSKILFERDIAFDPKSEKSYLYLAKIFNKKDNDEEQEINLNNVLLLNPQNDEAIYMLILLKIKQSDYNEASELIDRFTIVCKSFCSKKNEIEEKFKKLIPENAENKN